MEKRGNYGKEPARPIFSKKKTISHDEQQNLLK